MSGVNCEKCKYSYLLPVQPLDYNSAWECIGCDNSHSSDTIANKLAKFEEGIENVSPAEPEKYELLLRKMRYCLHENHYLITDVKRRLIDIYGHREGYEYDKLSKAVLERKCDYCDHLLSLAAVLSPGKSELRGFVTLHIFLLFYLSFSPRYLLWERHGAQLRLAQWDWLRMKVKISFFSSKLQHCFAVHDASVYC